MLIPHAFDDSRSQKMNATEEKLLQVQTSIVELLIVHAQRIGVVSESLYQRTCLMTECFGTEDELDGSDDNMLEDAKEARKKQRKRSGSLQGRKIFFVEQAFLLSRFSVCVCVGGGVHFFLFYSSPLFCVVHSKYFMFFFSVILKFIYLMNFVFFKNAN